MPQPTTITVQWKQLDSHVLGEESKMYEGLQKISQSLPKLLTPLPVERTSTTEIDAWASRENLCQLLQLLKAGWQRLTDVRRHIETYRDIRNERQSDTERKCNAWSHTEKDFQSKSSAWNPITTPGCLLCPVTQSSHRRLVESYSSHVPFVTRSISLITSWIIHSCPLRARLEQLYGAFKLDVHRIRSR